LNQKRKDVLALLDKYGLSYLSGSSTFYVFVDVSQKISDTKRYVIYSDYRNKLKYSISTNADISTLTANVLPTDTEIQVSDGSIFEFNSETSISQNKGVIWINGERIEYANVLGNTLLNCVRGISPRSHSIGDTVLYTNGENTDYPPIELSTIQYNAINYNL
jgi:hypothetical protein